MTPLIITHDAREIALTTLVAVLGLFVLAGLMIPLLAYLP